MEFKYFFWSTLLLVVLPIFRCTDTEQQEKVFNGDILAFVGEDTITVRQFRLNYEFGFARLKGDSARKASYLDYMIREKLLSREGYRLGLDKQPRVRKQEQHLLEELLREALFKKEVDDHIQITEEQVKEAINRSQVRWKMRYWMEPTPDRAQAVYAAMQQQGYEGYLQQAFRHHPKVSYRLKNRTTDYLGWLDIPSDLLQHITF